MKSFKYSESMCKSNPNQMDSLTNIMTPPCASRGIPCLRRHWRTECSDVSSMIYMTDVMTEHRVAGQRSTVLGTACTPSRAFLSAHVTYCKVGQQCCSIKAAAELRRRHKLRTSLRAILLCLDFRKQHSTGRFVDLQVMAMAATMSTASPAFLQRGGIASTSSR